MLASLPENAVRTYGSNWTCAHGFQRRAETCTAVIVPANAHLNASGDAWECDRRHRKSGEICLAVRVPSNAHEDNSLFSEGWACNRGFRREGGRCAAVIVPVGGFLLTGEDWSCERGFVRKADACIAVVVPANGYLDSEGHAWNCERGFSQSADACIALAVPHQAHLNFGGNTWSCNAGFDEVRGECLSKMRDRGTASRVTSWHCTGSSPSHREEILARCMKRRVESHPETPGTKDPRWAFDSSWRNWSWRCSRPALEHRGIVRQPPAAG